MLPMAEQLFGGDEFTFQHDLAATNNAKSTKTWFITYGIKIMSWLTNSPDLNSIKHLKKNREEDDGCLSTDYFGAAKGIHQASLELHYTCDCQRLVKFIPRQVQAMIAANGGLQC